MTASRSPATWALSGKTYLLFVEMRGGDGGETESIKRTALTLVFFLMAQSSGVFFRGVLSCTRRHVFRDCSPVGGNKQECWPNLKFSFGRGCVLHSTLVSVQRVTKLIFCCKSRPAFLGARFLTVVGVLYCTRYYMKVALMVCSTCLKKSDMNGKQC